MRYSRTVTCPRCGMVAERTLTKSPDHLFGSPYRVCRACQKTYFDPQYQEPAIYVYYDRGIGKGLEYLFYKQEFINEEKYHQEQLDLLEGRAGEQSEKLAESMERMSDRAYLDALRARGLGVPDYFYQRLRSDEPGSFVEPEGVIEVKKVKRYTTSV